MRNTPSLCSCAYEHHLRNHQGARRDDPNSERNGGLHEPGLGLVFANLAVSSQANGATRPPPQFAAPALRMDDGSAA
jgi:hypothetical protein